MSTLSSISLCMLLAAGASGCANAYADDRRDGRREYANGPGSAEPLASPAPPAPAAARDGETSRWMPTFETSFPEEASPAPTMAEWLKAPEAPDVRMMQSSCKAQRLREWYRVACPGQIEMISGQREGVSFECAASKDEGPSGCEPAAVRFPARRGDRRAFEIIVWGHWSLGPDAMVSEQFIDGDPAPLVAVHGIHGGL
jgi:hypothetical protein